MLRCFAVQFSIANPLITFLTLQDFPNHVMSRFLLDKIPNYRTWANTARLEIEQTTEVSKMVLGSNYSAHVFFSCGLNFSLFLPV